MHVTLTSGLTLMQALLLFIAGVLSGGLNALAGGGGFITLPALIFSGISPILANTSGTIAVWPGIVGSMVAYRKNLKTEKHPLILYFILVLLGSTLGAFLLLFSTNKFFMNILPFLLLFATVIFTFGKSITSRIMNLRNQMFVSGKIKVSENKTLVPKPIIYFLLFLIAIYGGYFGGGMGMMTLAVLALIGMDDIHEMNALKTLIVLIINGIGALIFIFEGKVAWPQCLVMMLGCLLGGYFAGYFVQRIDAKIVRRMIIAVAVSMTVYFFYRWMVTHQIY